MNRITIISILISFFALCSCVEEISHDGQNGEETNYISASFYADIAQTKTGLDGDNVIWNKGDQVKLVIWGSRLNYSNDKVENVVSFVFTTKIAGTDAYFSGKLSDTEEGDGYKIDTDDWFENDAIALYPTAVTADYANGRVRAYSYNLASSQTPVINSFAPNLALSSANISRSGIYSSAQEVSFQNACALIRIVVPEIKDLTSIKIESAGDVQSPLTGEISNLSYDSSNGYFTLPASPNAEKSVTLYDGKAIKSGTYNLVVWPGEHSKLKVTMTKSDGSACSKTLSPGSGTISLERSEYTVLNLTNFESATFTEVLEDLAVGMFLYSDGTYYSSPRNDKTLIGVVFHVGDVTDQDTGLKKQFPKGTSGLAVHPNSCTSSPYNGSNHNDGYGNTGIFYGYTQTQIFSNGRSSDLLTALSNANIDKTGNITNWYLPHYYEYQTLISNSVAVNNSLKLIDGSTEFDSSATYWLPLQYNTYNFRCTALNYGVPDFRAYYSYTYPTRFICAFYTEAGLGDEEEVTIELDQSSLSLGGDANSLTGKLAATASSGTVSWTSDNTSVATVSDGLVTVVGEGTANITATSDEDNTKSATCVVTVSYRKTPAVGDYVYSDGTWSVGYLSSTATPIGLVCYIGDLSADTKLKESYSSYNVVVADLNDTQAKIYNGNIDTPFEIPTGNSTTNLNKVSNASDITDKFYGYTLFNAWKVCYNWAAIVDHLITSMGYKDKGGVPNVYSGATCWYVPSVGEYKAICAMQTTNGLVKDSYTNITGELATLYMQDSSSTSQRGYIYKFDADSGTIVSTPVYTGENTFPIRKVFATTLANH